MMDDESQLKVQAYLDGELPEGERLEVESLLARDPGAAALLTELRHSRQAFASVESEFRLPESREFFWSKIERAIQRQDRERMRPEPESWMVRWRRLLVPVCATAALALVVVTSLQMQTGVAMRTPELEVTSVNGNALTYRDQEQGMTLVWFSYPSDDALADSEPNRILTN